MNARAPKGGDGTTQFARAMAELNIDILCANSPQAKGRVERAHQTLQDRLVKELRLRDITTIEQSNAFAPLFMADYNRRFARAPASLHDAHRALRLADDLALVLRRKEQRKLTQNLTIHYRRSVFIVEETPASLALRGKLVEVHELADGSVDLRHGALDLAATEFRKDGGVRQQDVEDNKYLASILKGLQTAQLARDEKKLGFARTQRERRLLRQSLEQRRPSQVQ